MKHLRYFLVLSEEQHFGRAAARLGMAQPPLSQRIRRLETELGVRLFDRGPRRVELTDAGRVFRTEAAAVLDRLDQAVDATRRADRGEIGSLRAGVPVDLPGSVLAGIVADFAGRRDLRIDLRELTGEQQVRLLRDRELDVGIVPQPVDTAGVTTGTELVLPLGVVLPRDSPLAGRARLSLPELAGSGLVLFPREGAAGYYDAILDTCRANGFVPQTVHHARNPEFLLGLVLAGRGVAFDTGPVARKETRVVWRPLEPVAPQLRLAVLWPPGSRHPAAEAFTRAVDAVLRSPEPVVPVADSAGVRPWDALYGRSR